MIFEPEEGADATHAFKLDLETAAGHDPAVTAPAGLMVEIGAIHIKILTDLFDLVFLARQSLA